MTLHPEHDAEGRVLLFPATRRDGEAIARFLERAAVHCAVGHRAIDVAREIERGAAALVLTDLGLAGPGGHLIVDALRSQPAWSDLPVVLLSPQHPSPEMRLQIARLTNVTLLDRPTSSRTLLSAIQTALRARARQYELRDQVAALHQAEDALRLADRRKDEFLAMLAHELRNPLAPIRTASELLPRIVPPGDERVDSTLRVVKRQIGQLSRLVDDLLDVSRITQGRIELQRETLDLQCVVAQALESVDPLMKEKGHVVLCDAGSEPLYVQGDRARLVQCVSNVLTNSAKYTDAGGRILIRLAQQGDDAVLSVRDNGIGIPAELLPRIFDRFVQNERSLDRAQGGLGIGLSVVQQLVAMHGGQIAASSAGEKQGTVLEIRLPLAAAPPSVTHAPEAEHPRSRHVLVVDDNRDAADSLCLLLQLHGHDVQAAYGAEEALALAARYPADLVLLDIGLPAMNGYEVARRLRSSGSCAHLVALTGYGQPEDVLRAREAGFDAHFVKPVDLQQLLDTLPA